MVEEIIGPILTNKNEVIKDEIMTYKFDIVNTSEALKDTTIVGIYFGAHWAPPSRLFTERLMEFRYVIE